MIVARSHIEKAYERALRLGAPHEEAVRAVAMAIALDENTVRDVVTSTAEPETL